MIFVLEDKNPELLYPHSLTRASFEIRVGFYTLIERALNKAKSNDTVILKVRSEIKDVIAERYPQCKVIDLSSRDSYEECEKMEMPVQSLWDAIYLNSEMLCKDFKDADRNHLNKSSLIQSTVYGERVYISHMAKVKSSILDSEHGPIYIDEGVSVGPGALIRGPVYIGKNSIVNPGSRICGGVSIGPVCKVGGEVEDSIIEGYSNKQHDGYLGHSYVGRWVNLGANTNVSNLKNNYSNVKVQLESDLIDTKKMFVGSLIGDHVKTAISTSLNTGTTIGLGANVFNNDFSLKFIKSFAWGREETTDFNKFISTAKKVKERRGRKISEPELELYKSIYINGIK